ncbi:prolyl-tRNA synthetase associated domain-containing protein [Candidatus Amesbacteria bacterium]|nr:prolyl-tRNA synthetase associated domain-containing protein [Candidatus Amesbacteria bacterium]MBI2587279.1 prolyl-tRNA synthetase associated domain-containing protein [Candidatus Amesbacteria bacterium]
MKNVYQILDSLGVKYVKHEHPAVFTCQEADKYWVNTAAAHTKNLFLKTEKPPHKYFLYILECKKRADLKSLSQSLSIGRLTFAKDYELMTILGLTPGSVSPFGLINDKSHQVQVLIDLSLKDWKILLFHPNTNTVTLEISSDDFTKFLSHTGHKPLPIK